MIIIVLIISTFISTLGAFAASNTVRVQLSDGVSNSIYSLLDRSINQNAQERQPHTMGEFIEGKIVCESLLPIEDLGEQAGTVRCETVLDNSDRGIGG